MATANQFPISAPDLVYNVSYDPDLGKLVTDGGFDDADPLAAETTSELQNLIQDCYHWLLCAPGGNLDDLTRGVGILNYLNGTTQDLVGLPGAIEQDFVKDPRITACSANVVKESDGSFTIAIQVETAMGVFPLTYGYSQSAGLVPILS
jgi:hypothetical protein